MRRLVPRLPWLVLVIACDRSGGDVREWQPSDHDRAEPPALARSASGSSPHAPVRGLSQEAMQQWGVHCARCHGKLGRGDGPDGPRLGARDLSHPQWQRATTDAMLLDAIRSGRDAMPAFDLPEPTLTSLVALIRMMSSPDEAPTAASTPPPSTTSLPDQTPRPPPSSASPADAAPRR